MWWTHRKIIPLLLTFISSFSIVFSFSRHALENLSTKKKINNDNKKKTQLKYKALGETDVTDEITFGWIWVTWEVAWITA